MKKTKDMIKEKALWGGLNKPDISIDEADIIVFGQAFDGATSVRKGTADGPRSIREYTYSIPPTTEDFESIEEIKVLDLGDFDEQNQKALFDKVENQVVEIIEKKKFFTMLGGDHSVTIPVFRGLNRALDKNFGIIHIDAHFDLCDTLSGSKHSHGCPERRATELERVDGSEGIYFVGIRSIEMDELEFKRNNKINVINAREFNEIGTKASVKRVVEYMKKYDYIYLTIDIDCLDPAYAAGTGTPQFGGLTSRQLLDFLRGIFELPIIGFDVVEVSPSLDSSLTSTFAARKIITECWGYHYKKNK